MGFPMDFSAAVFAVLVLGPLPVTAETAPDAVEIVPLYLNDAGSGILRFHDPANSTDTFTIATGGITDNKNRPFEVFGAFSGVVLGPDITFCVEDFRADQLPDGFGFDVYNTVTRKSVLRYRVKIDAARAEQITTYGTGAAPGECSNIYAP